MYLKEQFKQIPELCKQWKSNIAKAVKGLEDWVQEHMVKVSEGDQAVVYVTLADIKKKRGSKLTHGFNKNEHLANALMKYLGSERYRKDTDITKDLRLKMFWYGLMLKQDANVIYSSSS